MQKPSTANKTIEKSKAFHNEGILVLVITFAVFELDFCMVQEAAAKGTARRGRHWNLAAMKIITELFGT